MSSHAEPVKKPAPDAAVAHADPPAHRGATTAPSRISPAQADRLVAGGQAAAARGLAVQPTVDFGDQIVGAQATSPLHVFNVEPNAGATLMVKLVGDPSIVLVSAPGFVPTTADLRNGSTPIQLAFNPTSEAAVSATLILQASWANGARPPEEQRVTVVGTAHAAGQPTHAARQAQADADRTQRAEATALADVQERIEHHNNKPEGPKNSGHAHVLEEKRDLLRAALLDLTNSRETGVGEADTRIGEFKRTKPIPEQPSLFVELAWAALDIATASAASNIKNAITGPVSTLVGKLVKDEAGVKNIVGFLTEGVKSSVKKVSKHGINAAKEALEDDAPASHTAANSSIDARADFIAIQREAFLGDANTRATKTSQFIHASLRTMLDDDPHAAFAKMDEAIARLGPARATAKDSQRNATLEYWTRYLAQTSLGTVDAKAARASGKKAAAPGLALTNVEAAKQAPSQDQPLKTFDGLLDLRFNVNPGDPSQPAKLTSALLHGVRAGVANVLSTKALLAAGVPVRAVAEPDNKMPIPLVVVRDEAGNLSHIDKLGLAWEQPRWLSRKAGAREGSPAAQAAGARKLLEQELTPAATEVPLKTDGES